MWSDKSCDVGKYLYYENFKCRKKQIDKLVEECIESFNGNEIIYNRILLQYIFNYLSLFF